MVVTTDLLNMHKILPKVVIAVVTMQTSYQTHNLSITGNCRFTLSSFMFESLKMWLLLFKLITIRTTIMTSCHACILSYPFLFSTEITARVIAKCSHKKTGKFGWTTGNDFLPSYGKYNIEDIMCADWRDRRLMVQRLLQFLTSLLRHRVQHRGPQWDKFQVWIRRWERTSRWVLLYRSSPASHGPQAHLHTRHTTTNTS